jgi:hypothetical protein
VKRAWSTWSVRILWWWASSDIASGLGVWAVHKENMKPGVARLSTVLALLVLTAPFAAGAQPAGKMYRVGILGDKA